MHRSMSSVSRISLVVAMVFGLCLSIAGVGTQTTIAATGNESPFVMPSTTTDPMVGPVYMYGQGMICTYRPGYLAIQVYDHAAQRNILKEVYSPAGCLGNTTIGLRGMTPQVDFNPERDPKIGFTMIAIDHGREFHVGTCTNNVGNLAVFRNAEGTSDPVIDVYFVPELCAPRGMA